MKIDCRYFMDRNCAHVDVAIGYPSPLGDDVMCKQCQACGDPDSQGAKEVRDRLISSWIQSLKKNILLQEGPIMEALLIRHFTPEERLAVLNHPEFKWSYTRGQRWGGVVHSFKMAESWVRAVASRGIADNRVPLTVKGKRHESCTGQTLEGVSVGTVCSAMRLGKDGVHYWCGECGCGERPQAWLNGEPYSKLDYPHLMCARGKTGFSNEGHPAFSLSSEDSPLPPTPPLPETGPKTLASSDPSAPPDQTTMPSLIPSLEPPT